MQKESPEEVLKKYIDNLVAERNEAISQLKSLEKMFRKCCKKKKKEK